MAITSSKDAAMTTVDGMPEHGGMQAKWQAAEQVYGRHGECAAPGVYRKQQHNFWGPAGEGRK